MTRPIEGGCFCGEIRYQVSDRPVFELFCYCKDCLAITGTDGYAGYMVKQSDFKLISGKPCTHDKRSVSGRIVKRHFCGTCGSNLWGLTEFGLISVAAGSLDDPEQFKPTKKVFTHDAPSWARIPETLEEM